MRATGSSPQFSAEDLKKGSCSRNEAEVKPKELEDNAAYQLYRYNAIESTRTKAIQAAQTLCHEALQLNANNRSS